MNSFSCSLFPLSRYRVIIVLLFELVSDLNFDLFLFFKWFQFSFQFVIFYSLIFSILWLFLISVFIIFASFFHSYLSIYLSIRFLVYLSHSFLFYSCFLFPCSNFYFYRLLISAFRFPFTIKSFELYSRNRISIKMIC